MIAPPSFETAYCAGAIPLPLAGAQDPVLRGRSTPVEKIDHDVLSGAGRVVATLRDFRAKNGYGRAMSAVQVGWPLRLVAMDLGAGPVLLINPEVTWRSEATFEVWDDCLSVPDVVVRVRRNASISLTFRDHRFRLRRWNRLPPDLSELIQHEIDHLDGVLMTERATGDGAIQPMARWAELVGAARPRPRISLDAIREASDWIDPAFLATPQYECEPLLHSLGAPLTLKVETANPIRSFKGRGASYFIRRAVRDGSVAPGYVCASAGNFGQAIAYACRDAKLPLTVFAAENANPMKVARMRAMGANVRLVGRDMDAAKAEARAWADQQGVAFVEDGRETAITEGAGTIGRELLARDDAFDAVLVAVGNGALVNGVGRWIKAASPSTEIIGVSAAGAPAMERSWRNGPAGPLVETASVSTIADGVAVRVPVPEAVHDMFAVVDDMLLVDDDSIRTAVELVQDQAGLILEPSGALGVAAILANKTRFLGRRVATILCGGNTSRA